MKLNKLTMSRQFTSPGGKSLSTGVVPLGAELGIASVKSSAGFDQSRLQAVEPIAYPENIHTGRKHGLNRHPNGGVSATLNGLMDLVSVGEINRIKSLLDECSREDLDRCTESYVQSLVHLSLTIMKKVKGSKHYES